jgi:hypothetical protein
MTETVEPVLSVVLNGAAVWRLCRLYGESLCAAPRCVQIDLGAT